MYYAAFDVMRKIFKKQALTSGCTYPRSPTCVFFASIGYNAPVGWRCKRTEKLHLKIENNRGKRNAYGKPCRSRRENAPSFS